MAPLITYPPGPITPHGAYWLAKGTHPEVVLKAWDGSIEFNVMGGRALADKVKAPEVALLTKIDGLIPPWRHVDQKGATQDGITHVDALYDPIEVNAEFACRGRQGPYLRTVVRDLIASIDAIKESELGWFTQEMGYWWASIRWLQGAPQMPLVGGQQTRQNMPLRLRADTGFWRSYAVTQSVTGNYNGFVPLINVGDQPMYWDVVCYGPGTFTFSDGPVGVSGTPATVTFGPLVTNQIALIRTDPRKRGVYDLTITAPPQQVYNQFQSLLIKFLQLASNNNLPPLLLAIESCFGIAPPQGPLYSLLQGRFSDLAAIPPKSPGAPTATPYNIKVTVTGAGLATKAILCGIPLRRYPI